MSNRQLHDPESDGWESTDFPVVCEDCLGPNPYVRMMKQQYGSECAISGRPFTVFRWKPGSEARYKKTVVCREVALAKNVCQVCLLDLEFGVPVQVRDAVVRGSGAAEDATNGSGTATGMDGSVVIPESDANREYVTEQLARKIAEGGDLAVCGSAGAGGKISSEKAEILRRMRRNHGPYYKKNKPPICTFWIRGACTRADCPYRPCNGDYDMPELSSSHTLRNQNMKDRYYGTNDPVAKQMLNRMNSSSSNKASKLIPPEDTSITTLYVGFGGVDDASCSAVTEQSVHEALFLYGEIKSVRVIPAKKCAFVTFMLRKSAERCMTERGLSGVTIALDKNSSNGGLGEVKVNLSWGRPAGASSGRQQHQQKETSQHQPQRQSIPTMYPSMDPNAMGSR